MGWETGDWVNNQMTWTRNYVLKDEELLIVNYLWK